ncbi:hypothetical protein G7068_09165 [Leucobacter viscericola]|uniref:Uncharacterized protein n=1 Tax=Leucobacter viscericola TaxID=2714935 RepID=A0A6G7XFG1_9MICO|nr:hypothetical protein [Leucobacter viscericola]QIK63350.1 hypothetical protein G7068_09165 [Leucobacter viscericola]
MTPVEDQFEIPEDCDELIPISVIQSFDPRLELHTHSEEAEAQFAVLLGPKTMAALTSGRESIYCGWGISHTDAFGYVGAAVISDSVKKDLLHSLRDSVYVEREATTNAEAIFVRSQSVEHQYMSEVDFDGNLLVASAYSISGDFAKAALESLRKN